MRRRDIRPPLGRLFSGEEAALFLGISRRRVRALIDAGELIAQRNPRGRLDGIYEAECEAWQHRTRQVIVHARRGSTVDQDMERILPPRHLREFGS